MIKNKKLFIISFLACFLLGSIDGVLIILGIIRAGTPASAVMFIVNAVLGTIVYTLMYQSLNKTELIKKIYRFVIFIAIMLFVVGVAMLLFYCLG